MRKFLAVVKREYLQRVRSKMFILMTVLAPVVLSFLGIVPGLMFSIQAGGPLKIEVVDGTGKLYQHLNNALHGDAVPTPPPDVTEIQKGNPSRGVEFAARAATNIELHEVPTSGRAIDDVRTELDKRVSGREINGYLFLPPDLLEGGKAEFFASNPGDVFTKRILQESLSRAVTEQRLKEANIDTKTIQELSRPVELQSMRIGTTGGQRDSGEGFLMVFGFGFVMYLTILLYGQVVLGAIIEEKETRIAEILFSSVRPFTLMMGKLVGVSLVALTQLAIWGIAFGAFLLYGVNLLASRGMAVHIPGIPAIHYFYFALFFLLGYYVYSTMYAFVGAMVTTPQEGGQLAMPIVLVLVVGFYLFLPVSRSPDSSFAFWVSMLPFFAPITMMVRIATQTPPAWEILLSLIIGVATVVFLVWVASRIYRTGMLMYGKKATISEVVRWVRQA
ncbi:MAG TPA: ABC transporter permease [Pyrinomonadaceae bacterium]